MFSEIKKLIKHSGIYALGVSSQALLGFLLVPVYTRVLSQADFGRLEILQTFLKVLLFLIPLGFTSALLKCYHRDAKNQTQKRELVSTAFIFILLLAVLEILFLSFFAGSLSCFLIKINFPIIIYLLLGSAFFAVLTELTLSFLRAREKSKRYILFFILRFILILGATLYLVLGLDLGLSGVILGGLIGQAIVCTFALSYLLKYVKIVYSKRALTRLLAFGLPILPASIAMWVMDLSDRYFLRFFGNFSEVALYSLGYRIGFILEVLLVIPFQLAWPAFSFRIAKRQDHRKIYVRTLTYFFLIATFGVLVLSFFGPEIIKILAPSNYASAFRVVPAVALAYVFYGLHFVLAPGIHLREKTKYYPFLIIFPAILNIILNFYFVPRYGMIGAAVTTVFSFVLVLILTYFVSQHFYPLKQEWRRLIRILTMAAIVFGLSRFLFWPEESVGILTKVVLLLFFWIGLWGLGFFTKEEISKVRSLFTRSR